MITTDTETKKALTEKEDDIHRVLFLCTGNTCRSPMAEAVYNFLAKKYNLNTRAFSAGVAANGSPMSAHAHTALLEKGYIDDGYEFASRQIDAQMCETADSLVGLTEAHAMRLMMAFPTCATKIRSLSSDISDPFGGYIGRYRECLGEIEKAVK